MVGPINRKAVARSWKQHRAPLHSAAPPSPPRTGRRHGAAVAAPFRSDPDVLSAMKVEASGEAEWAAKNHNEGLETCWIHGRIYLQMALANGISLGRLRRGFVDGPVSVFHRQASGTPPTP